MRIGLIGIITGIVWTVSTPVMAEKPSFKGYVASLKQEGINKGIDISLIDKAFNGIRHREKAVKADRNQPEMRLTLNEYISLAVPDWKVKKARRLYAEHYNGLKRIGDHYGVQPRFLVSLWGIESNFGALIGNYDVLEALTTLAYDGRREDFFRAEIFSALTILQQGHIDVRAMKGSWAGAMGQCQFLPSSFLSFAADGNNDGKKDIWNSELDVFASSANYLNNVGWDNNYTWGRKVTLPKKLDINLLGLSEGKARSLAEWQAIGIKPVNRKKFPNVDINAWLIQPDHRNGQAYIVYGNYQSLMKWNRSHYFALAVSHLADKIKSI
ncbi:lytic murein transglycosylase [Candidatus Enterovibrio escicola]|uniref:Membrane-bound lytic murein transglycosylase B n=1 Tax=Candidatus Enterovibrio escicola TaxID=1927127 RepID=A0A2A5T440_9GAMM|nr:lytic murein transglycosylase [Candidatus Enterovibrio escacola]PCS22888.1 Membrane-bound lytic murein transglycosylase B [Candidatus Enterovibrio escacola]